MFTRFLPEQKTWRKPPHNGALDNGILANSW